MATPKRHVDEEMDTTPKRRRFDVALENDIANVPDILLVMVLAHLDVADLLNCRVVCKRLLRLVADRDVWRHRILCNGYKANANALLHLAPCLKELFILGDTLSLTTTKCAVEELHLHISFAANELHQPVVTSAELALVVRVQEALGRLKRLHLRCSRQLADGDVLLRTLAANSDLESLELLGLAPFANQPVLQGPTRSSLKRFQCILTQNSESFVTTVLAGHAATLETIDLGVPSHKYRAYTGGAFDTTTARLLGAMPNLQELRCGLVPGLESLAASETLKALRLIVHTFERRAIEGAAETLRGASQLRTVSLDYSFTNGNEDRASEVGVKLIDALGSSRRRSQVEWLSLNAPPQVWPLLRALPSLAALRVLSVHMSLDDEVLLPRITPDTAPGLRVLVLHSNTEDSNLLAECTHQWMHKERVTAAVLRNPSLHVLAWESFQCGDEDCVACTQGCHQEEVVWGQTLGLTSHDLEECPSPEHHDDEPGGWKCSWVLIRENPA